MGIDIQIFASKLTVEQIQKLPWRDYLAVDSIRISVVSDDAEEIHRTVQVAVAGGTFVLFVLSERTVIFWE